VSEPTSIYVENLTVPNSVGFGTAVDVETHAAQHVRLVVDPAEVGSDEGARLVVSAVYPRPGGDDPMVVQVDSFAVVTDITVHDYELNGVVPQIRLVPQLESAHSAAGSTFNALVLLP
jgi:hypothetical protein